MDPILLLLFLPAILLAITVHEYSHGRMALAMGDRTALVHGRLTLNPLAHLDPLGTLMIALVMFGWAKPVPINPYNFSDFRRGLLYVSLAGPFSNFALALVSLFLMGILGGAGLVNDFLLIFSQLNTALGVFNLLPVPPLDGSKVLIALLPPSMARTYRQVEPYAPLVLILILLTPLRGILGIILELVYSTMIVLVNILI